jgi:hypothetical protein
MKGREFNIPFYGKVTLVKKKSSDDYSKMSDSPEKINHAPIEPDFNHSYLSNSQPAVSVKAPSSRERLVQSLPSAPGFLKKKKKEVDDPAEDRGFNNPSFPSTNFK